MAVSATASGVPKLCCSTRNHRRLNPASRLKRSVKFVIDSNNRSSATAFQRSFPIRAFNSQTEEESSSLDEPSTAFIPQVCFSIIFRVFFFCLRKYGYSSEIQNLLYFNAIQLTSFVFRYLSVDWHVKKKKKKCWGKCELDWILPYRLECSENGNFLLSEFLRWYPNLGVRVDLVQKLKFLSFLSPN